MTVVSLGDFDSFTIIFFGVGLFCTNLGILMVFKTISANLAMLVGPTEGKKSLKDIPKED